MPRQGHNTPLPLKRSPPVSFKRLLGGALLSRRPDGRCVLGIGSLDDLMGFPDILEERGRGRVLHPMRVGGHTPLSGRYARQDPLHSDPGLGRRRALHALAEELRPAAVTRERSRLLAFESP